MSEQERVNILLVDDQPSKLLSVQAILEPLGENVLTADSADEALRLLLAHDVAVVLVDVCMPRMDGFELVALIREHPRFRRTAIIFISAIHLTDADRIKAYGLGAVDYIPVPIVPELLRAKVSVFAELYRKTNQLHRLNRELERRVAERTADLESSGARARESEKRYRELVHCLPAAVYNCDERGRVVLYNQAAVELWGRTPELGKDMWCGSWKLYRPDGTPLPLEDCPMAVTLREGRPVRGQEILVERPDGSRRFVLPYPEPMFDDTGSLVGAVNMLADVTDSREAERAHALLASVVASSDDAIVSKTLDGTITSWNAGARRIFGYEPEEIVGRSIRTIIPPDKDDEESDILARLSRGEHIRHFETIRLTKDGRRIDVSVTLSPVRDAQGRVIGASKVARDVGDRKAAEEALRRHRDQLDTLVRERTEELERTNQRLRLADRMATIGTLSAGLGHDMGNLLLPVRMRLDAIEASDLPGPVREDVAAIRKACEYLQRLARSLRSLSLDPEAESSADASTELAAWWTEVEGMVRNGVGRTVALAARFEPDLPPVRLGKAALTQIVFNLVQNAGDALRGRPDGAVTVHASHTSQSAVRLSVADNGPGMSEEARQRCLEPFFTTKTRGLSTGLGLTLVSGIVKRTGGKMQVDSSPGGTTFTLDLPVAASRGEAGTDRRRSLAVVSVRNPRLLAHVESVLSSMAYQIRRDEGAEAPSEADVWVTEVPDERALEAVRRFADSRPARRAIVFANTRGPAGADPSVLCLTPEVKPSVLRERLRGALATSGAGGQE